MATNGDAVAKRTGKGSSQDRRQVEHPGSMASQLSAELYLRSMVTYLKEEGVFDVAEGRPHPRERELVDRPVPAISSDSQIRVLLIWHDN